MRRPSTPTQTSESILAGTDRDAFQGFPGLRGFFLATCYEDASCPREPGTLFVRSEPTRWVWVLKDPTASTQLQVAAPTWDEVQLLAEVLLNDDKAPWVNDPWASKRRKGR